MSLEGRQVYQCVKTQGKASAHSCVQCVEEGVSKPAIDWAHLHTETGDDPWADFVPLCRLHHVRYDGIHRRPDVRAKISASLAGRPRSEEARRKQAAAITGKPRSEETRRKISDTLMNKTPSEKEEWSRRISDGAKASWKCGRRRTSADSSEWRSRISEGLKASWERRRNNA